MGGVAEERDTMPSSSPLHPTDTAIAVVEDPTQSTAKRKRYAPPIPDDDDDDDTNNDPPPGPQDSPRSCCVLICCSDSKCFQQQCKLCRPTMAGHNNPYSYFDAPGMTGTASGYDFPYQDAPHHSNDHDHLNPPHTYEHPSFGDPLQCDLACQDLSFCDSPCDPSLYLDPYLHPAPCCDDGQLVQGAPECPLPHISCDLPPEAHSPCQEPGCQEPAETECCHDPYCADTGACFTLPCFEEHPADEDCTTCCMSDVCPHPGQHHHHYDPFPAGYVPWQRHQPESAVPLPPTSSSERSSVEPRLSAALQAHLPQSISPTTTTDPRDTPLSSAPSLTDSATPVHHHHHHHSHTRGGHRRLQGASALQTSGLYTCQWHLPTDPTPCNQTFPTAEALHTHISKSHIQSSHPTTTSGPSPLHPCHWHGCATPPFPTKPKLARHLHSHTLFKPHICPHPSCGQTFITTQQLTVHLKTHTGEKPFPCHLCGKTFAYRDLLKSHLRSGVHGEAEKRFQCNICGEAFADSSNRTKHAKSVHDSVAGVPCPEAGCGYVDTRREKLRRHCEENGHGGIVVGDLGRWEEYFNRESGRRKKGGRKRKRGGCEVGVGVA